MEVWRQIPGYSLYEASNLGRIRHINLKKIRKLNLCKNGYLTVTVRSDSWKIGDSKPSVKVHKLISLAFLGKKPLNMQVDHINRVRTDNRIENLRIVTPDQNMANKGLFSKSIVEQIIKMYKEGKDLIKIVDTLNLR